MAELVAGAFLSTFFQGIFDRLASSNFTDYFRRGKLEKFVEELESTLDSINQVLDDAEKKQYENPDVKKWLGDVKHAMYEADQLLDEIATDAPLKKLKAESQPSTSNIFNFIPTLTNPFESRIKELIKSLDSLAEKKDKLQLKNQTSTRNEVGFNLKPPERLPTTYLVDASGIYGREDDKGEMIKILLSENATENQVPVISIMGLGGIGKTTFAKLVFNDPLIEEHFELRAWVYVSESFDVIRLTKDILKSFNSPADDESLLNLLHKQLQQRLTGKKYLLVLDDIWNGNEQSWEELLRPFNHGSSGSKIIVTTRDKEVAYVLKSTKLFNLQQLQNNDCWSLFVRHAFHGKSACEYPHLESIGRKIVGKCGGLPLAVKSLGQLLGKKFSQHEWINILETDMWRLSDGDNNINPVLRLSYHNLPSNRKRCFAYCSIFPKGYRFKKDELVKLWMAEGLLKCCRRYTLEEELGNDIFRDLESISFFQKSGKFYSMQCLVSDLAKSGKFYSMHDLVSDLAKSVLGEFCMQIKGVGVVDIPERTRHIWFSIPSHRDDYFSFKKPKGLDNLLEPICELKGLRSLMIQRGMGAVMCITNNMQHDLFSRLKCLRMLSFRGCDLSEVVDEISNLKLLRYLDLSCNWISCLPDTICMLLNLQTLLLENCNKLTKLPSNFCKLVNLRHLKLPDQILMDTKHIGKLKNLQDLPFFVVKEENGYDLKALEKLNQIHGTIRIEGLGNVIDPAYAVTANLKDKKYLEELYMKFDFEREEEESDGRREETDESMESDGGREETDESVVESNLVSVLESLQPNSNLKRLTISQYKGDRFPNWLRGCHLPNLVSLELLRCGLCSHLPPLGELPLLKELSIYDCDGIKIIGEEFCGNNSTNNPFRSLEVLRFKDMFNWEEWLCLEGFLSLKELSLCNCSKLKKALPQHLPSLQKLDISGCNKLEELLFLGEFPLLKEICISNSPELKRALPQHLPSLQKLKISDCNKLEASIPKGDNLIELDIYRCDRILVNELPISLKRLVIDGNRYIEFSVDQNLINFPFLEALELDWSCSVKCPSLDLRCYNSLQTLSLTGWRSSSLPFSLNLFTKLHCLKLYDCPELESFPMGGLPSNLRTLEIFNCPKLIASREEWGLFQLNFLKEFKVSDDFENVESFPEENLLPRTLNSLRLSNCSKLRIMNNKGFLHLKRLQNLYIINCPNLERLPEEALPNSLSTLWISNCPSLERLPEKEALPNSLSYLFIEDCPIYLEEGECSATNS